MSATLLTRPVVAPPSRAAFGKVVVTETDRPDQYPTLSDTTVRVMELADRDNASVAEVAGAVRRDGVLAAQILRAANTAAYRGRGTVEDLQQAVLRIGLRECTRLLCAMSMRKVYAGYAGPVRARCDALLRHSLFVAKLASGLSKDANIGASGTAFTGGLLHDIGRVVLCVKCDGTVADPPETREDEETPAAERAAYGIDHCAIGYQFATRNGLPETIIRTVLNHHRPEEEHFQRALVALVAVAERVGNHVQWKHTVADYDLEGCPRFEVLSKDWGGKRRDAFRAGLPAVAVQAIRDTRRMLKSVA
jgi:putative nucleotidyltransferase with HDIG domain